MPQLCMAGFPRQQRERVMGEFHNGLTRILVATDVASRGLDIKNVTFVVAYMTLGGLDRFRSVLADLAARTHAEIIVGIDHRLTTFEALEDALSIPRLTVRIFNINNPWIVFHPKVYVFEEKQSLTLVIGSSNFTDGGLFSNFDGHEFTGGRQNNYH
jgi:phosphatidylserine/phosphatidylglycerophosphate/cardiolipin synthase-like enzyme